MRQGNFFHPRVASVFMYILIIQLIGCKHLVNIEPEKESICDADIMVFTILGRKSRTGSLIYQLFLTEKG